MKHSLIIILFLLNVHHSFAQEDTSCKNIVTNDSVVTTINNKVYFKPTLPAYPYFSIYSESLLMKRNNSVFYTYRYVPDKKYSSVLSTAAIVLLGYFGSKTNHPYNYQPYQR